MTDGTNTDRRPTWQYALAGVLLIIVIAVALTAVASPSATADRVCTDELGAEWSAQAVDTADSGQPVVVCERTDANGTETERITVAADRIGVIDS